MPPLFGLDACSVQVQSSWKPQDAPIKHKSVRFDDDVRIVKIPLVAEEYRMQYWMSREEYVRIRQESMETAKMAQSKCVTKRGDLRGLEHKTPHGILRRQKNRSMALNAVLTEQDFQIRTGYSDPDWIGKKKIAKEKCDTHHTF